MIIMMDAETLHKHIKENDCTIMDVRTKYDVYPDGEAAYEAGHIPGAIFLDVKRDVTGKHTFLPDPDRFAEKLGALGICAEDKILLYDQGNHRAASKVWVALYYLGHEQVYILNGGYEAWRAEAYDESVTIEQKTPTTYKANVRQNAVVDLGNVKQQLAEKSITLIDSRTFERYSGQVEPKYKKAGHIPGAVNYETKQTFDELGKLKSRSALQDHFNGINPKEKVVVSCGSGNSATVNMVALKEAGYEDVSLFSGGFGEWIEDDDNEVAAGKENKK